MLGNVLGKMKGVINYDLDYCSDPYCSVVAGIQFWCWWFAYSRPAGDRPHSLPCTVYWRAGP